MATLDDKLLGEKLHNYCSSSEDEGEEEQPSQPLPPPPTTNTSNTGPKGVIKDWQRFKQLETEKREEADRERLELAKKLNLSCKSAREEEEEKKREQEIEEEMKELMDDDFMKEYMKKRMEEMIESTKPAKKFGRLISLKNCDEYLAAIDEEEASSNVILLIQEPGVPGCEAMVGCCQFLAREYVTVKFCQIAASVAGLSKHFKESGVPALLVYRGGQLLGSFITLVEQFGEDIYANDIEAFLLEHGMLPANEQPKLIRDSQTNKDDSD